MDRSASSLIGRAEFLKKSSFWLPVLTTVTNSGPMPVFASSVLAAFALPFRSPLKVRLDAPNSHALLPIVSDLSAVDKTAQFRIEAQRYSPRSRYVISKHRTRAGALMERAGMSAQRKRYSIIR
jgi:hypothetical protein